MTTFSYYQKIGIYPRDRTHPRIIPAITEISRAVGAPDVAMSTYQATGVGLHKTGEACDFQAGNIQKFPHRYQEARDIHNMIAKYVLKNWERLNVRYMAWDGWEYGGSWGGPERKRKQATSYGGSDPWHQHHVHVDFKPGNIPNANPGIAIGAALAPTPKPTPSPIRLEDDMKLVKAPNDAKVYATNGITKRYIKTPAELTALNKLFGATVILDKVALDAIPEDRTAALKDIASDILKTKAATGRNEARAKDLISAMEAALDVLAVVQTEVHDPTSKKTLRERTEQTNHAVGRAEKARLEAEAKETEK